MKLQNLLCSWTGDILVPMLMRYKHFVELCYYLNLCVDMVAKSLKICLSLLIYVFIFITDFFALQLIA